LGTILCKDSLIRKNLQERWCGNSARQILPSPGHWVGADFYCHTALGMFTQEGEVKELGRLWLAQHAPKILEQLAVN
jgi:hypothetical protein